MKMHKMVFHTSVHREVSNRHTHTKKPQKPKNRKKKRLLIFLQMERRRNMLWRVSGHISGLFLLEARIFEM